MPATFLAVGTGFIAAASERKTAECGHSISVPTAEALSPLARDHREFQSGTNIGACVYVVSATSNLQSIRGFTAAQSGLLFLLSSGRDCLLRAIVRPPDRQVPAHDGDGGSAAPVRAGVDLARRCR
jgi:hypothetical protein